MGQPIESEFLARNRYVLIRFSREQQKKTIKTHWGRLTCKAWVERFSRHLSGDAILEEIEYQGKTRRVKWLILHVPHPTQPDGTYYQQVQSRVQGRISDDSIQLSSAERSCHELRNN